MYKNFDFDALYLKLYLADEIEEKEAIIRKMMFILNNDMPWVYLYHPIQFSLIHKWYKNYKPFPLPISFLHYRNIDLKERQTYRESENKPAYWVLVIICALLAFGVYSAMREKKKLS